MQKDKVAAANQNKPLPTRAVIFDFDGTLTVNYNKGDSSWRRIWAAIGQEELDKKYLQMFRRGKLGYEEWLQIVLKAYKQGGVNTKTLQEAARTTVLLPGTHDTFKALHMRDIKIFILSSGIRQVINYVLCDVAKFVHTIEAYDLVIDKNDKLQNLQPPHHDLEKKEEFVEIVKQTHALNAAEVLFVGNGANDETVYKSGAVTLCINPDDASPNNKIYWTHAIKCCKNLTEILRYVK